MSDWLAPEPLWTPCRSEKSLTQSAVEPRSSMKFTAKRLSALVSLGRADGGFG